MSVLVGRRPVFVSIVAFAALTALVVISVAPAGAAGSSSAVTLCNPLAPAGTDLFDSLARLAPVSAARGSEELREPNLGQSAAEAPRSNKGKPSTGITVPTYVHVITPDGVTGNVPDHKIRDQINVLDLTYGGFYGGYATGFDFELVEITRTVNEAWYNTGPSTAAEQEMKQALRTGGDDALNLYLTTAGPYLGWAYSPAILDSTQAYLDGVVIDWETLPKVSATYANRYDRGYTATHEAGHWLNLNHTFDGSCGALGDGVDDTPAERTSTSGCPVGKDTCLGQPGLDPIHNYMDYSYDACYTEFTAGQGTRMFDAWMYWRA